MLRERDFFLKSDNSEENKAKEWQRFDKDFQDLIDAYQTDHQLCFVYMQRNVFRNMSKSDAEEFNVALAKIKLISDYEEAVKEFESLCSRYEKKYPAYIKMLKGNIEKYLCYKKYPEGLQKHIYRTNIMEYSFMNLGRFLTVGLRSRHNFLDKCLDLIYSHALSPLFEPAGGMYISIILSIFINGKDKTHMRH